MDSRNVLHVILLVLIAKDHPINSAPNVMCLYILIMDSVYQNALIYYLPMNFLEFAFH